MYYDKPPGKKELEKMPKYLRPMVLAVHTENFVHRQEAVEKLAETRHPIAFKYLLKVVKREGQHTPIRGVTARILGEWGNKRAAPVLLKAAKEVDMENTISDLVWALGKLRHAPAVKFIHKQKWAGSYLTESAYDALGEIASEEAIKSIVKSLRSGKPTHAELAKKALKKAMETKSKKNPRIAMGLKLIDPQEYPESFLKLYSFMQDKRMQKKPILWWSITAKQLVAKEPDLKTRGRHIA